MINVRVNKNANFRSMLLADIGEGISFASVAAAADLYEKHAAGDRTGNWWPEDPRQASAFGEYPQEQHGNLRASIAAHDYPTPEEYANYIMFSKVGFFDEDFDKIRQLEFGDGDDYSSAFGGANLFENEEGERINTGMRMPLYQFFVGKDYDNTRDLMMNAMRDRS